MSKLTQTKSKCGCKKMDELMYRFDMIDVATISPVGQRLNESEMVFRIKVGKTLSGYNILEPIEYCPFCGNRLDGELSD